MDYLEKSKVRGVRKFHEKRVQLKRLKYWLQHDRWHDRNERLGDKVNDVFWQTIKNKFKHVTTTCSCPMCKPWKHKCDKKYTPAERRKNPNIAQ